MCVDSMDLNKHIPKDSYPPPMIDMLVDAITGYSHMSFLDAFSRYYQIFMTENDTEKTTFILEQGTFCYVAMPFGLKIAGATYQRLIYYVFHQQRSWNVEAWVDDILVKSRGFT